MSESRTIRTRFPPEPNGFLHIGHLKAMLADFELPGGNPENHKIVCNLRYDDTNPDNETEEYKEAIRDDIKWLGFCPNAITNTSDYFPILLAFIDKLLQVGEAYYDCSTSEEISKQRENNVLSPYRPGGEKYTDNIPELSDESGWCVRLTVPEELHKSTCMRDPVIARWKSGSGLVPTYDISHPIVDYLESITNSYCTREFFIRRELYYYVIKVYRTHGDESINSDEVTIPEVMEFSRLKIEGVELSKRKILASIKSGQYCGFDDPRLFTIRGLRNRGHDAGALLHFCRKLSYVEGDGGVTPMHMFEHAVREYYEKHAVRRFGIPESKLLPVNVENSYLMGITLSRPNHPENVEMGKNILAVNSELYISKDDFQVEHDKKYTRFAPDRPVWLRHYGMVECLRYDEHPIGCRLIDGKAGKKVKPRPTAIQWINPKESLNLKIYDPDIDTTEVWRIEKNIPESTVFQLERCGYYRYLDGGLIKVIDLKSKYTGK